MQDRKNRSQLQWFDQYKASKTVLFWACAGSVIVATVAGFSWGGWVTGGTAQAMADKAAAQARQELAAVVCVDRFMAAPDAGVQLTALQEMTSSYAQGQFVQDGGWAIMPLDGSAEPAVAGSSTDDRRAAGLCAEELAKREIAEARPSRAGRRRGGRGAIVAAPRSGAREAASRKRPPDRSWPRGLPYGVILTVAADQRGGAHHVP